MTYEIARVMLDGFQLPVQFSYRPPAPKKRHTVIQTAGGVSVQSAPQVFDGDSMIAWTCQACTRDEYELFLRLLHNDSTEGYEFCGYWGERMTVRFLQMDDPEVRATNFNLSGSFQVVDVANWGTGEL